MFDLYQRRQICLQLLREDDEERQRELIDMLRELVTAVDGDSEPIDPAA